MVACEVHLATTDDAKLRNTWACLNSTKRMLAVNWLQSDCGSFPKTSKTLYAAISKTKNILPDYWSWAPHFGTLTGLRQFINTKWFRAFHSCFPLRIFAVRTLVAQLTAMRMRSIIAIKTFNIHCVLEGLPKMRLFFFHSEDFIPHMCLQPLASIITKNKLQHIG